MVFGTPGAAGSWRGSLVHGGVSGSRKLSETLGGFVFGVQVLVDAPNITRCAMSLRRLSITGLKVDISKVPDKAALKSALTEADIEGAWAASTWGKKLAKTSARKALTDFERYKVMVARVKRSALIKKALK